jgi:putative transposase
VQRTSLKACPYEVKNNLVMCEWRLYPRPHEATMIKRKNAPRLTDFDYEGSYAYFVTCATLHKKPYFTEKKSAEMLIPVLSKASENNHFVIYVYCFMPDHMHLLLSGEDASSLKHFMHEFKYKSGFLFKKHYNQILWQRGYYDRVLRREQNLQDIGLYILNNPVRKGLVEDYRDYELLGSFVFNVKELTYKPEGMSLG